MPGRTLGALRRLARAWAGAAVPQRKWPFPPTPPGQAQPCTPCTDSQPRSVQAVQPAQARALHAQAELSGAATQAATQVLSTKAKIIDVLLVAVWGAMIPALMWLGAAGGF
ncbi:hypothetical protein B1838_2877 [Bordetella pertussis]|uniref:Membrane protein n=2 Tax=Bordetella pertussis TaxID=520 RepID=Q7VZE2_BORPE|nr:membrane protein [Bordetella pertussis]AIW93141.1 hypothetical protein B1917_2874 [Bordetella pertussis B1917]AIW94933.1 hypothetical protein B1920_0973 [Bordetella pertussis B1920]AJB25695.1 hypothetical protein Q425_9100 [Bordetella pertussis 137]CAE41275.1 putative membrane protein [Bordetella pertussis Tohama I]CCJ62737.1 putative membrane protein [Bordetella pertussis 18323]